mmetsp:Transcript_21756/g.47697  ORF Transcript_21756/g.47697 Transcript_21756/m.47697 type:complete len:206 (-) Transcript_21756:822-1439(-)
MSAAMLNGCPNILKGIGTGSNNKHSLVPKVQLTWLISITVTNSSFELVRVLPVDFATFSNAPVHLEAHCRRLQHMLRGVNQRLHVHQVGSVGLLLDLFHIHPATDFAIGMLASYIVDVSHDALPRSVIFVGSHPTACLFKNSIANLRSVHSGAVVAIKFPDAFNLMVSVKDNKRFARLRHDFGLVNACNARTDDDAIHFLWNRTI